MTASVLIMIVSPWILTFCAPQTTVFNHGSSGLQTHGHQNMHLLYNTFAMGALTISCRHG